MIWKVLLIIILLPLAYYILSFLLTLFNKLFNPYLDWYEKNKEHLSKNEEELPGFGEWNRHIQRRALIILIIIIVLGLILLLFIE